MKHQHVIQKTGPILSRTAVINQVVGEKESRLQLVRPFADLEVSDAPVTEASMLETLRASQQVQLVGRDAAMEQAKRWLTQPSPLNLGHDHRVAIIHGPAGAGKTRLAAEILRVAEQEGWIAGFLPGDRPAEPDWPALGHPDERVAVGIDYAESRHQDLKNLFDPAPIGHEGEGALRVILIVREQKAPSESWLERLSGVWQFGPQATKLLVGDPQVFSLVESLPRPSDRAALWKDVSQLLDQTGGGSPPEYLQEDPFESPIYVMLDAYDDFFGRRSGDGSATRPPSPEALIDSALRHERRYWTHALKDLELSLTNKQMNEVAIAATLLHGLQIDAFDEALTALPWLQGNSELRKQICDWWSSVYATGAGLIRGVEPDIVGEHLVIRGLGQQRHPRDQLGGLLRPDQLAALVSAAELPGRQRILRVLTRIATTGTGSDGAEARNALADILSRHLGEFLPSTFARSPTGLGLQAQAGEALATTLASAVLAGNALELVGPPLDEITDKTVRDVSMQSNALRIVRHQIERVAEREHAAGRWPAEHYAALVAWSWQFELEERDTGLFGGSDRGDVEARAAAQIQHLESLEPRPHLPIATLLQRLGGLMQRNGNNEAAGRLYRRALDELNEMEDQTHFRHSILYSLGLAIARTEVESEEATHYFEEALALGLTLEDSSPRSVISPLVRLADQVTGKEGVEAGLARLDTGLQEVASKIESIEESTYGSARSQFFFLAARRFESAEEHAEAEALYLRSLEEMTSAGNDESGEAFVLWHELGDVAAAQGKRALALERYERSADGKRSTVGPTHPSTVITLIKLAEQLAPNDLEAARQMLDKTASQLDPALHQDQIQQIRSSEMTLLADADLFDEAAEVARQVRQKQGLESVRLAIFESAADPTHLREVDSLGACLQGALVAAKVFSPGDTRLTALGSALAHLYTRLVGEMIASQMHSTDIEQMFHQEEATGSPANIEAAVPHMRDLVSEVQGQVALLIDHSLEDPLLSSLHREVVGDAPSLADDIALRSWLTRMALAPSPDVTELLNNLMLLLAFYVWLRVGSPGISRESPFDEALRVKAWLQPAAMSNLSSEKQQMLEDLVSVTAEDKREWLASLLDRGVVQALASAAQWAERKGQREDAEAIYAMAEAQIPPDAEHEFLRHTLFQTIGDGLLERGDATRAIPYLDRGLKSGFEVPERSWHAIGMTVKSLLEGKEMLDPGNVPSEARRYILMLEEKGAEPEDLAPLCKWLKAREEKST